MVLHEHQANPHVHLSVRAESQTGKRLNPRKTDLHRWRETFAEKPRGWGVEAEATRQATRGESRNFDPLWRVKAKQEGRLRQSATATKTGQHHWDSRAKAMEGWAYILLSNVRDNERALELTQTQFRVGSTDRRSVEQRQLALYTARTSLLRVQSERLAQRINLHLALGGSFGEAAPSSGPVAAR
jgi:hypothetical protein